MISKIIALYGAGNKGKTETLNLVIDLLQVLTSGCPMPAPQVSGNDREGTFIYNGKKVSICTKGDGINEIQNNISYFKTNQCEVAICATRTKGSSRNALIAFANSIPLKKIDWVKKIYNFQNNNSVNIQQARNIIKLI